MSWSYWWRFWFGHIVFHRPLSYTFPAFTKGTKNLHSPNSTSIQAPFVDWLFFGFSWLGLFSSREELQIRIAIFSASASLSGALSGLFAYWLIQLDGVRGIPGWAWIFIVRSFTLDSTLPRDRLNLLFSFSFFFRLKASLPLSLACLVFLSFHYLLRLVDSWHQSRESKTSSSWSVAHLPNLSPLWLSISPRILAIRIEKDQPGSTEEEDCHFSWTQVWKAYRSPHVLLASLALFMTGTNLYSLAYFQPTSQSSFFFFIFFPMGCLWLTFYLTWVIFHDRMNEHSYSFREFFFHFVFWKQDSRLYCIGLYVYIISPVHQFGYSRSYTQLISVPPFAVGFFGQSNYHLKSSDMKLRNLMLLGSHDLDILFLRSLPGSWIHRNPMCGRRRKWYKHYLCSSVPLIWHLSFGSYLDIYFSSSIPHTTVVMCHSFSRLQEYTLSPPRSTPGLPITPCHIIDEQLQ